jgi:Rieske 2Fe-2S family protein
VTALERTLPREHYFSPEIFAREQERIFWRDWFVVGRAEELAEPGGVWIFEMRQRADDG